MCRALIVGARCVARLDRSRRVSCIDCWRALRRARRYRPAAHTVAAFASLRLREAPWPGDGAVQLATRPSAAALKQVRRVRNEALTRPPPGQAASPPQKSPLSGTACRDAGEWCSNAGIAPPCGSACEVVECGQGFDRLSPNGEWARPERKLGLSPNGEREWGIPTLACQHRLGKSACGWVAPRNQTGRLR